MVSSLLMDCMASMTRCDWLFLVLYPRVIARVECPKIC